MCGRYGWIVAGLLVAAPGMAQAQQNGGSGNRLMFDPSGLQNPGNSKFVAEPSTPTTGQAARDAAPVAPAKKTAKPSATSDAKPSAKPAAAARRLPQANDDRTVAGPARPTERPIPRVQPTPLGRVSIPGGTLGYESETSMRAYDLSDGRRVPGYENIQRNDSSYFGLSLRLPSSSQSAPSLFRSHGID